MRWAGEKRREQELGKWEKLLPLIFLFNVALVYPALFPRLHDINAWDEAIYIEHGRELAQGHLPLYSDNPAVSLLYALTWLPVRSSPFWLVYSCRLGRLILFGLLWLACYRVSRRFANLVHPLIIIGLLVVSPAARSLLDNGSNALFAAMSGFALAEFLAFYQTQQLHHARLTSVFVGLAATVEE